MPIRALLFDKDGTIVDFDRTWGRASTVVLRVLARDDEAVVARLADAAGFDRQTETFRPDSPFIAGAIHEFSPDWAGALGVPDDDALRHRIDALYQAAGHETVTAIPGAIEGLRLAAARGIPMGIATNDSEAGAEGNLAKLGIRDLFAFVAGYDSGHGAKPSPGMVLAFARQLGLPTSEVALIGDSVHDMAAARAAGAMAVAVTTGPMGADMLARHADLVCGGIGEVVERVMS